MTIRQVIPLAFFCSQTDIDNGLANSLPAGSSIFIIDTNNQPTGKEYRATGTTAPTEGSGGIKNNLAATTAPTSSNDSTQGYSVGSRWIDTTNNESYICTKATNPASWSQTTVGIIGEVAGLQTALDGKSATTHNHDAAYTAIAHGTNVSNPHSVTKTQVGLGSADNTADSSKPVSTAQQTALDGKSATTHNHTGTYEPSNANIQSHVTAAHAPANAEANLQPDWNQATTTSDDFIKNKPTSMTPSAHTHAESEVTNLTTDLAAKQATLVSGTNIKTVNGTSVMGSGDITFPTFATSLRLMTPTDILEDTDRAIYLLADDLALGALATWANPGTGGDFAQVTAGSQPLVETVATLGGRNAALFDGNSDYMQSTNISLGTRYGLFVVIRTGSSVGGAGITLPVLSEIFSGGTVEYMFGLEAAKFGVGHYNGAWRNFDATTPVPAISTSYIMLAGYDGANLTVKIDGGTASTAAQTSDPTLTEAGDIMLGRRWDGTVATNYVWNGHIACVVAKRNAYFTATEIAQLEGWAAWYYGRVVVLPTGHTYKNAPPLITA